MNNEKVPKMFSRRISPTKSSATQGRVELLTAAVERGPSQGARSGKQRKLRTPLHHTFQARSIFLQGWGLIDLPLRASNEGSPRPRVARARRSSGSIPSSVPRAGGRLGCPPPLLIVLSLWHQHPLNCVAGVFLPPHSSKHLNRIPL